MLSYKKAFLSCNWTLGIFIFVFKLLFIFFSISISLAASFSQFLIIFHDVWVSLNTLKIIYWYSLSGLTAFGVPWLVVIANTWIGGGTTVFPPVGYWGLNLSDFCPAEIKPKIFSMVFNVPIISLIPLLSFQMHPLFKTFYVAFLIQPVFWCTCSFLTTLSPAWYTLLYLFSPYSFLLILWGSAE